jgi:hypothetical protein
MITRPDHPSNRIHPTTTRKMRKRERWLRWALQIAKKKNLFVNTNFCGYGKTHRICKVQRHGNLTFVKSNACSGCAAGAFDLSSGNKNEKARCVLLRHMWMVIEKNTKATVPNKLIIIDKVKLL